VKTQPGTVTRRKLSAVVRKAITSYYNEQEYEQIVKAARQQGVSMSSFVAAAATNRARQSKSS
jgi:uncharacterized protein (DUF1778 family)